MGSRILPGDGHKVARIGDSPLARELMSTRTAAVSVPALVLATLAGCAHERPRPRNPVETTSATVELRKDQGVNVSDEVRRACKIHDASKTPNFDYDSSDLSSFDRDVLAQVARCFTTGPLQGRSVYLIGRADPRGEAEYNMGLGEWRADSVHDYLAGLGVDPAKMDETSRGELDATGTDESGWRIDRRVDLRLKKK